MAAHQVAEGLASLGRGKDTMLMHVTPREVAGLQNLAMAQGGSLTINPQTGLPEAGWFDDILGAVAPIALGALLGPAGIGLASSALGAGLMTGAAGFALSGGDLGAGLSAGLGGAGGFGLGSSLGSVGAAAKIPQVSTIGADATSAFGNVAPASLAAPGASSASSLFPATAGSSSLSGTASSMFPATAASTGTTAATNLMGKTVPYSFGDIGRGAKEVFSNPMAAFKSGQIDIADALTVASPLMAIKPPAYKAPEDDGYQMNYEGPYTPQDRDVRNPSVAEQEALRAAGSPEYAYFGNANPYPGFNKTPGYAEGGLTNAYGSPDGTLAQNTPSEPYGLGRLQLMAQGGYPTYAGGGAIAFDAGGQIPQMGGPALMPSPAPMGAPQMPQQDPLKAGIANALTDPMGRLVSKAMGGGIHSLTKGGKAMPGGYLDGAGDGMSDSIPATIEGKQPARLADGEFVMPADVVSHLGNGSTKAGAQHLYKVMDKVRKARTGNKKQGKQINPNKFMSA